MRAYVPVTWGQLAVLHEEGTIGGPLRACSVDPQWRAGSPDIDEEQWEFEAAQLAAAALGPSGGVVLAVDVTPVDVTAGWLDDGWWSLARVDRSRAAAVLTADLSWYAVQEIPDLLAERQGR